MIVCLDIFLTDGQANLLLVTRLGYALWFDEEEASLVGQRAAGVKGINLKEGDYTVGAVSFKGDQTPEIMIATQRGAVKKMSVYKEFEKSSRARRGLILLRELKSHPHRIAGAVLVQKNETVWLETAKGNRIPISTSQYKNSDRYSNGSYAVDQDEAGYVLEVWKSLAEADK